MKKSLLFIGFLFLTIYLNAATEQYCLSYRDDPATTIVIGWSGALGTVHYGTTDEGTAHTAYPSSQGVSRTGNAHGHNRRFARLTGLTPNTMYYFVIHDLNGDVSDRFKFRTLSDDPEDSVSFITGGDSRDGFKTLGIYFENCPSGNCLDKRRDGNELVAKIKPDFIAFNGDFVMNQITSNSEAEFDQWFDDWQLTISSDGRMYPTMHVQGNHEDNNDIYELFDVPQEEYYALNINNGLLRLYMLNSELNACTDAAQLNWLTSDLQNHNTGGSADPYWKFSMFHKPIYSMGNNYGLNNDQMDCWVNLFQQNGVRMVCESHAHITKWTYPCVANANNSDFEVDQENGIVYIGEGQWGAPHRNLDYTGNNQKPYVRDQDVFDSFFFVSVSKTQTRIQCVKFENINAVSENTDDELGAGLPLGITLWQPSNGDMIILYNEIDFTSTEEKQQLYETSIYPNPAVNEVNVNFSKDVKNANVKLYNSLGKLCSEEVVSGSQVSISLENACSGVNYIYIETPDGKIDSYKFIKQ